MFNVQTRGAGMRRVYVFALLALQIATYFLVLCKSTDLTYELYYALIVSCFITSLVLVNRSNQSIFQFCALLFTCIADYCLILEQGTKIVGVSFFTIVQLFYCLRTLAMAKGEKERLLNLGIRVVGMAFLPFFVDLVFGGKVETLFLLSATYYVNLLVNILFSFLHFRENKLLPIGLVLFALCDLTLGLTELCGVFGWGKDTVIYQLLHPGFALEAAFYMPSQVILSVSATKKCE